MTLNSTEVPALVHRCNNTCQDLPVCNIRCTSSPVTACLDRDEDFREYLENLENQRQGKSLESCDQKSVYIMCIYEYESAAERLAGLDMKADSLSGLF